MRRSTETAKKADAPLERILKNQIEIMRALSDINPEEFWKLEMATEDTLKALNEE